MPAALPPPAKPPAIVAPSAAGRLPIRGYVEAISQLLTARDGTQTRGSVACPIGKVPLGGGALVTSGSIFANLNSSFPSFTGWTVDVNNATGFDTTFQVMAICAKQPRRYSIQVSNVVANPANTQSVAVALCPAGSLPLGGGAQSGSTNLFVNLDTTQPFGNQWKIFENNATTPDIDTTVQAYAVCGKLPGYNVQQGLPSPNPPVTQTLVEAHCPAGTLPTGGGLISDFSNVGVNLNTSEPSGDSWFAFENNASAFTPQALATVVCAGAS